MAGDGEDGVLFGGSVTVAGMCVRDGFGLPLGTSCLAKEPPESVDATEMVDESDAVECGWCLGEFPKAGLLVADLVAAVAARAAAWRQARSVKCQSASDVLCPASCFSVEEGRREHLDI